MEFSPLEAARHSLLIGDLDAAWSAAELNIQRLGDVESSELWGFRFVHSEVMRIRGRIEQALDYLESLPSPSSEDLENCIAFKMHRGYCAGLLSRFGVGHKLLAEAKETSVNAKLLALIGDIQLRQAMVFFLQRKFDAADETYREVLELSKQVGGWYLHAAAHAGIGKVLMIQDHHREAIPWFEKAYKINEEQGVWYQTARLSSELAVCYLGLGDPDKSLEFFQRAERVMLQIGAIPNYQVCVANIGNVYLYRGEYGTAIEHYQRALAMAREIKDPVSIGKWTHNLNIAYSRLKEQTERQGSENVRAS